MMEAWAAFAATKPAAGKVVIPMQRRKAEGRMKRNCAFWIQNSEFSVILDFRLMIDCS